MIKHITMAFAIIAFLLLPLISAAYAETTVETVRRMCTAPDNQDFSVFDPDLLPSILIDIIRNDPADADYHDRVVVSALQELGRLGVGEGTDVFVEKVDEYPETCLYWLPTWTRPDVIRAIAYCFDNKDPGVRLEAFDAFTRLQPVDETDEELEIALIEAREIMEERIGVEDDPDVLDELHKAYEYAEEIMPEGSSSL
jgi:hypothetical protein